MKDDGTWMSEAARDALLLRKSSEEFKKILAQCSANRTKHKKNGKVLGTHNMGRRSAIEQAAEMAKNAGGKMPTAFELFKRAHTPKRKEMVESGMPMSVMESFTNEIAKLDEQGISYKKYEVYYKSAGGRKKGQVFGVGNAQSLFFGSSVSSTAAAAQSYTPGVLTQLQTHHEQLIKEAVDKVNQENEERLQKMNQENEERLRQMQSQIELEMMHKFEERFVQLALLLKMTLLLAEETLMKMALTLRLHFSH
ncbi:uncharacterized protein LOC141586847 [Silene latifolia]|uniref:uncharacterized protein LOC141586847 n=1 Tax=Silene latifolia TaxID=37657 RepID=UPI003D76BEFC